MKPYVIKGLSYSFGFIAVCVCYFFLNEQGVNDFAARGISIVGGYIVYRMCTGINSGGAFQDDISFEEASPCPNCGTEYNESDYSPDSSEWMCTTCKTLLPRDE